MTKYSDLLRDPRWQKKRLEILSRDEYADSSLITLCEKCHQIETEHLWASKTRLLKVLSEMTWLAEHYDRLSAGLMNANFQNEPVEIASAILEFAVSNPRGWIALRDLFWEDVQRRSAEIRAAMQSDMV